MAMLSLVRPLWPALGWRPRVKPPLPLGLSPLGHGVGLFSHPAALSLLVFP